MAEAPKKSVRDWAGIKIFRWMRNILILLAILVFALFIAKELLLKIALNQIGELVDAQVKVQSIDMNTKGLVSIKKLVIAPRRAEYDDTILKAETVYASFSVPSFFLLRPRLKQLNISDFIFNAQKNLDTMAWNIRAIQVQKRKGRAINFPVIMLDNGVLQYTEVSDEKPRLAASIALSAKFGPANDVDDEYEFNITTVSANTRLARANLSGSWKPGGRLTIAGGILSADMPMLERNCRIDVMAAQLDYDKENNYSLKLRLKDMFLTDLQQESSAAEPVSVAAGLGPINSLIKFFNLYQPAGRLDIDLDASGDLLQPGESSISGTVICKDISICKSDFQYPVSNIAGRISFTEKSLALNNLSGRNGDSAFFFNGWSMNSDNASQYDITVTSNNLLFDDKLYNSLSEKHKKLWAVYNPKGIAAIDYRFTRQDETGKRISLAIQSIDAQALCTYFPYPLTNLRGSITLDSQGASISNLISQSDNHIITINGSVKTRRIGKALYDISIKTRNTPLDSVLAAALPENQKKLYNQLNLTGLADANFRVFNNQQEIDKPDFEAEILFKETSLQTSLLPLAFTDVSGKAIFTTDLIDIRQFNGNCSHGKISLTGQIHPGSQDKKLRYELVFAAESTELSSELFELMPGEFKPTLQKLQPGGFINYQAALTNTLNPDTPNYDIKVNCMGNSLGSELFGYPLKDIFGTIKIKNRAQKTVLEFEKISANIADSVRILPQEPSINIDGLLTLNKNSFWDALLKIQAHDIFIDQRLESALPNHLKKYYTAFSPTGRFDLDIENIKILSAPKDRKYIDFTGTSILKDCTLKTSPALTELNAAVKIKGIYDTDAGLGDTRFGIDANSLRIDNKILTDLNANIYYDAERKNWESENFVANCYKGKLAGKFQLQRTDEKTSEYLLQMYFDNIGLKQFLEDSNRRQESQNSYTSGNMNGSVDVSGTVGKKDGKLGRFRLKITDMEVGKASALGKFLDVLKLSVPKDFAFDQMLVDSYIKQDKMLFEKIDISGDNIAFTGSGVLNMENQNLDLSLTARGRRLATSEPSVLQSLTEGLGQAVVRMNVSGNLYEPQITTRTLPIIQDTLGLLGTKPDINNR